LLVCVGMAIVQSFDQVEWGRLGFAELQGEPSVRSTSSIFTAPFTAVSPPGLPMKTAWVLRNVAGERPRVSATAFLMSSPPI
jgi:hypothetical protein